METEILLIRHGETEWNKKHIFQGKKDTELNSTGIEQAYKLSEYLAQKDYQFLYSSDLKRAVRTAEIIGKPNNLEPVKDSRIREMNFGNWEGSSFSEISKKDAETLKKWREDPLNNAPTGGEKLSEFISRITEFFNFLADRHKGEKTIVVTHGGVIKVWLSELFDMPADKFWQIEVNNTSMSRVKIYDDDPIFSLLNAVPHLKSEGE
ncbi:MAG: alpha-ribazole phosphatase [Bacillota bacterium]